VSVQSIVAAVGVTITVFTVLVKLVADYTKLKTKIDANAVWGGGVESRLEAVKTELHTVLVEHEQVKKDIAVLQATDKEHTLGVLELEKSYIRIEEKLSGISDTLVRLVEEMKAKKL
jgi:predicted aspartyl protease